MPVPAFTPDYLELLADRPGRFTSRDEAESHAFVDGWPWDRSFWPEWTWPHLTDAMVDQQLSLPFRLVYAVLVERSGLPVTSRAVLHYLARRCGGPNGAHRRAWPKLDIIADRIGASRRAVQYAVQSAEESGWLLVVRYRKSPSDYILDVPDYVTCPCLDCTTGAQDETDKGADGAPQGADGAPLEGADGAPQGADIAHALGSEHLVQPLSSDHSRRTSDDVTTSRVDPDGQDKETDPRQEAANYAAILGREVATGRLERDQAAEMFHGMDRLRPYADAFAEGFERGHAEGLAQEDAA